MNITCQSRDVKMDSTSTDTLQLIFTYLDVGEISRKNLTNHLFDRVCKSESLWKNKLSEDYSIVKKRNESWRNKAKEVYIESNLFWDNIDDGIDYCMKDDYAVKYLIDVFEKSLVDHALRERKEFFAIEIIFKAFFQFHYTTSYLNHGYFYVNFISLFERVAELYPRKKISIKWILDFEYDDDYGDDNILERIRTLVSIYLK